MRALLDTHAFVWAMTSQSNQLSSRAVEIISDVENGILLSAASGWEIATKVRLGKLPEAVVLERHLSDAAEAAGYMVVPVTLHHALAAGRLSGAHRDPFDRMIAAQALALDVPVISKDEKLDSFGVRRIW